MNRPFSAFAALMTLLGLAMFAVSSTSRSTMVKPAARAQGSGHHGDSDGRRVQRQAFEVRSQKSASRRKQVVGKAEDKSFSKATIGAALKSLAMRSTEKRAAMRSARIIMAENLPARVRNAAPVDYRSHYDPSYDLVVYGIRDGAVEMPTVEAESETLSVNLAGELDVIFHELASRQASTPPLPAGAMKVERTVYRWKALAAAVGGWLKYHGSRAMELDLSREVGWAEYAEFADEIGTRNAATFEVARTSDAKKGVRSGDWLRHSAASSLHRLSLILEAAAGKLEGFSGPALSAIGN